MLIKIEINQNILDYLHASHSLVGGELYVKGMYHRHF